MVEISPIIKAKLDEVLPTYFELYLDEYAPAPCITFQCIGNNTITRGDTLGYTQYTVKLKIWADNLADLATYAEQVDKKLNETGRWTIQACNDYTASGLFAKVIDFVGHIREKY